jgi:hypothetical protein
MWIDVNPTTSKQGLKRDENKVANSLASLAKRCKFSEARWGSAHASAKDLLMADCNIVLPN